MGAKAFLYHFKLLHTHPAIDPQTKLEFIQNDWLHQNEEKNSSYFFNWVDPKTNCRLTQYPQNSLLDRKMDKIEIEKEQESGWREAVL